MTTMLVNTDLCLHCNACTVECARNNDLPVGHNVKWTQVNRVEHGTYPAVQQHFIKYACNHCTQASCMNVCPTRAITKPDGVHTVVNQDWCIGCGYCVEACPFHVPSFGEPRGSSQKCSFCYGTHATDDQPACSAACPYFALTYGEREQMIANGHEQVERLRQRGYPDATLYGEHELGGLHILYVLQERPAVYGLPENPRVATQRVGADWLSGLLTAGLLALFPFWLMFKREGAPTAQTAEGQKEAKA